jgi:hypothetical protein
VVEKMSAPSSSGEEMNTNTERWRGAVDERLRALDKTVIETSKDVTRIFDKVETLQNQVTKLVVAVGLGAFFGSAIVSVIVGVTIKMISK